ncbi:hypothetical protein KJ632_00670 [Patescibacteria group bacterium]|nr:hypothetical protein [Patescibacteria group bacterium]
MKKISFLVLALLLFQVNSAFAANTFLDRLKEKVSDVPDAKIFIDNASRDNCQVSLNVIYDALFKNYLNFLDIHFKNKDATSSLTNTAIANYIDFKKDVEGLYTIVLARTASDLTEWNDTYWNYSLGETGLAQKMYADENKDTKAELVPWRYAKISDYMVKCQGIQDQYIESAKKILMDRIATAATQKRQIILVDKYNDINEKLRGLQFHIIEMVNLYTTFQKRYPSFTGDKMRQ